jgi:hypothetical protein
MHPKTCNIVTYQRELKGSALILTLNFPTALHNTLEQICLLLDGFHIEL